MWYLISTLNPDEKYTLLVGKEYLVGRKDCDIIISGDASVSRKHAILKVSHSEGNLTDPQKLSVLTVQDSSKYGIYINKVKVTDKDSHQLKDGDEVVFGTKLAYMVVYEPFVISMSCLDNIKKKTVRKLVCSLGGHVVSEWQKDCSLLVMNTINVTIKVICAMASLKHIVTPDYIEEYVRYLKGEIGEPNPESFLPNVSEAQIDPTEVSFKRNPKRSSVFRGMTFIFLNAKQYKKMNMAVELGGGMSLLMDENSAGDDSLLIQKGTVVMNYMIDTSTQSQIGQGWIQHVQKYLKKHKKHMIQDAELGYAVLYCSTEKHCNPDNDFLSQMMQRVPSQSLSQADILVANTELATQISSQRCQVTNGPDTINETKMAAVSDDKNKNNTLKISTNVKDEPLSPAHSTHSRVQSQSDKQKISSKQSPSTHLKTEKVQISSEKSLSPRQKSPSPIPQTNRKTRSRSKSPVQSNKKHEESALQNRSKLNTSNEDDFEFPFGKTIKQEIVTPTRSAAKTGCRNRDTDTEIKMEMKWSQNKKNDMDDSSNKSNTNECPRQKQSVFDSIQFASQQKDKGETIGNLHSKNVKVKIIDDLDEKRKKKRKNFDDSDEDVVEIPKRKRIQEVDDDEEEFFAPRKKIQNKQNVDDKKKENKTKKRVADKEQNESFTIKKKFTNKSDIESEEDMFHSSGKLERKTAGDINTFKKLEPTSDENSASDVDNKQETLAVKKKTNKIKQTLLDKDQDEDEEEESTKRRAGVKHETSFGFLTTVIPIQDQVCKTESEKEDNLPSNCVVTEFVTLIPKKKKTIITETDTCDSPSGHMKWKGKLVKNFKKFKKTLHTGSNELPRIIGGSDLEAHVTSERKEIDEWFRNALESESQQNEADRRATELFEWEPSHGSKRKGR